MQLVHWSGGSGLRCGELCCGLLKLQRRD
eukprot:COSAG02_NODE_77310_length_126_cov_177.407407_1_plen_28_part_10